VVFEGVGRVSVAEVPDPSIEEPDDAIVRVALAGICGTDLHFLHGQPALEPGDTLGHEAVGVVAAVGPEVSRFRPGDRVVVAFNIVCGRCWFCRRGQTSLCGEFRNLGAGAVGGALGGAQAELLRVPRADVNLMAVPEDLEDERALFLGDVLTTGYYGTAVAGISPGDTVAVVGAGPVGFFCVQGARAHGAGQVVALDSVEDRLALAERAGAVPVHVGRRNPEVAVDELTEGRGADVAVDAVGHPSAFDTAVRVIRRGGGVAVVGMYTTQTVSLQLGVYWFRQVRLVFAGVCPVHAWWDRALRALVEGKVDPTPLVSHRLPLAEAPRGYELFDSRQATKVVLRP
jgi:threonine dehydrogenase-like Zn-dependent dehydrogenase